jgi:hypothetical protein
LQLSFRLGEYITLTSFIWGLYLIWLIPFQLWWVGLSIEQFWTWLLWGTLFEYIIAYPIGKAIIKYGRKIELYWKDLSDNHDKKG